MFAFIQEPKKQQTTGGGDGGGGSNPETLILIHGFPTSSYDFHKVLDEGWLDEYRVVLFDHVGFGFSEKPDVSRIVSMIIGGV